MFRKSTRRWRAPLMQFRDVYYLLCLCPRDLPGGVNFDLLVNGFIHSGCLHTVLWTWLAYKWQTFTGSWKLESPRWSVSSFLVCVCVCVCVKRFVCILGIFGSSCNLLSLVLSQHLSFMENKTNLHVALIFIGGFFSLFGCTGSLLPYSGFLWCGCAAQTSRFGGFSGAERRLHVFGLQQ